MVPHTAHRVREAAVVRSLYRYERTRVNVELVKQLQRSLTAGWKNVAVSHTSAAQNCGPSLHNGIRTLLPGQPRVAF